MNLQNVSLEEPTEQQLTAFEEWVHYEVNANRKLNGLPAISAVNAREYLKLAYHFASRFAALKLDRQPS